MSTQTGGLWGVCPLLEDATGETINISEYLDFGFHDHVSYKENTRFGMTDGRLVAGTVISQTTVQKSTNIEKETEEVKESIKEKDTKISHQFKEERDLTHDGAKTNPEDWSEYLQNDTDFQEELMDNIINDLGVLEASYEFTPDMFDNTYLNMEVGHNKRWRWTQVCQSDQTFREQG